MKRTIKAVSCLSIMLLIGLTPFDSVAGWDYKSDVSLDRMKGRTYLVTHCENKLGDDCNMPGSASRIDVSILASIKLPKF